MIVRPKEDDSYEMIAGHRRRYASELAEKTEIPCIVRNLSDEEATILIRIGFRHLDAEMFLQFAYGGTDCARHLFDIDNLTARHALHGFGDHVDDVESAVGVLAAGCRRHAARTEVDGHYVVLVFRLHVIFPFAKKRPCRCSPVIIPAAQGGLPFAAYHLAVVFEVDVVPFVPALFRHGLSVKGQQFIEFPFVTV